MEHDFKNSDLIAREKLEGIQMSPPADAWAGIQSGISTRKKRRGIFFWVFGLLIFSGVAAYSWYSLASNNQSSTNILTDNLLNTKDLKNRKNVKFGKDSSSNKNKQVNVDSHKGEGDNDEYSAEKERRTTEVGSKKGATKNGGKSSKKDPAFTKGTKKTDSNLKGNNSNALSIDTTNPSDPSFGGNTLDPKLTANTTSSDETRSSSEEGSGKSSEFPTLTEQSLLTPLEVAPLDHQMPMSLSIINNNYRNRFLNRFSGEFGVGLNSFRYTANNTASSDLPQYLNDAQSGENGLDGFARINYHINPWFSVHSGFEFTQQQSNIQYNIVTTTNVVYLDTIGFYIDTVTQQQFPITDSVYTTETTVSPQNINNRESYISIPFGAMLDFPIGIRSEIGLNVSGLLGIRTKASGIALTDENNNSVALESAYKSTGNLTLRFGIRYSYAITERNFVYIEPYVGFGLNNRSQPVLPYDTRFSNTGIRFGLRRNF